MCQEKRGSFVTNPYSQMTDIEQYIGILGSLTRDTITSDYGYTYEGLGGVLYQAAVCCARGQRTSLLAHLGQDIAPDVKNIVSAWKSLDTRGLLPIPHPANRVRLHYPAVGERVELLETVVPPLVPSFFEELLPQLSLLICVMNSGYDITLEHFQKMIENITCPVWLDIHSLVLEKKLNEPRHYTAFEKWTEWIDGVSFLQANRKEVSCLLGKPDREVTIDDFHDLSLLAFNKRVKAVFCTLGKNGVWVATSEQLQHIAGFDSDDMVDSTGCGDVFCAATALKLLAGHTPFDAARSGQKFAVFAGKYRGVAEIFRQFENVI